MLADILQVFLYTVTLWFSLYLLNHDFKNPRLRYAGIGLGAYALALAFNLFALNTDTFTLSQIFHRIHWAFLFLPPLFWSGTILHLLPDHETNRIKTINVWKKGLLPLIGLISLSMLSTNLLWSLSLGQPAPIGFALFGLDGLLPLISFLCLIPHIRADYSLKRTAGIILAATLFFSLGVGVIVLPLSWLPPPWGVIGIGFDLGILGIAVAWFDAFDQGEALLPDFLRSLTASMLSAFVFGTLVVSGMVAGLGQTISTLVLLLATISAALLLQTLSDPIQSLVDRLVFASLPNLRKSRAELRAAASALPRLSRTLDLENMSPDEIAHLTRRAISNFANLPKLASSPLTRLPLIDHRLQKRGAPLHTLERSSELKAVLEESIARLKPRGEESFGTTDEWRFYNSLHFPYVVGLHPYSQRLTYNGLDSTSREALKWFRTSVPERTLYNWQSAASKLVARDILEQNKKHAS